MLNWKMFLEYAKTHPLEIPKSTSARSKMYKNIMTECTCGKSDHKLCNMFMIDNRIKDKDSNKDSLKITILEKKIQSMQSIINSLQDENKALLDEIDEYKLVIQQLINKNKHNKIKRHSAQL